MIKDRKEHEKKVNEEIWNSKTFNINLWKITNKFRNTEERNDVGQKVYMLQTVKSVPQRKNLEFSVIAWSNLT